ncbi:uncharacterized protein [Trachinotus anak]|uniref:uncharacterized protein n=1 Tax=Trachinotus anak TaxID=443729 RepID=UPI0039F16DD3
MDVLSMVFPRWLSSVNGASSRRLRQHPIITITILIVVVAALGPDTMAALDRLREFVEQRLSAAVEEIFEFFQKTITDYEEELDRYRKVLDTVFLPEIRLRREDVHSLTAKAKVPPVQQQGIRPSLPQEDPQPPQPPHIKVEQEEVWTSQREEQLQIEGAAVLDVPPVSVKTEEDTEAGPPDQMETSADVEDCEGSGGNSTSDWSPPQRKNREELSRLNRGNLCKTQSGPVTHERGHLRQTPYCRPLQQSRDGTSPPFSCSHCGQWFSHSDALQQHLMSHRTETPE